MLVPNVSPQTLLQLEIIVLYLIVLCAGTAYKVHSRIITPDYRVSDFAGKLRSQNPTRHRKLILKKENMGQQ